MPLSFDLDPRQRAASGRADLLCKGYAKELLEL